MAKFTIPNVQSDHALQVLFKALASLFNVHVEAGPGGSVSPVGDVSVAAGDSLTISITPDAGFELDKILLDGVESAPDPE